MRLSTAWFRKRWALACIALLGAAALFGAVLLTSMVSTSAARHEQSNINLSDITLPEFALGIVDARGKVAEASSDEPLPLLFDNGAQLVPGGSARSELTIFNNSEHLSSTVSVAVAPVGDGSVVIDGTTRPNITRFLRVTITDQDGNTLLNRVPVEDARLTLAKMPPRGDQALDAGAAFTPGADGSKYTLEIRIDYVDAPETLDYVTGLSALTLVFEATSANA